MPEWVVVGLDAAMRELNKRATKALRALRTGLDDRNQFLRAESKSRHFGSSPKYRWELSSTGGGPVMALPARHLPALFKIWSRVSVVG
jgi:hypothetical protein